MKSKSMTKQLVPILGFAAFSGTGKTTLLEALIPNLTKAGLRLGILKHAHHNFDIDQEGKDSYRLRKAGANQMLISSRNRFALMTETPENESEFDYLLSRFDQQKLDLILVEGCKNIAFAKIELHREITNKPWLYPNDNNIIAIASDSDILDCDLPQLDINDLTSITQFVLDFVARKGEIGKEITSSMADPANCDTLSPAFLSVKQAQDKILSLVSALEETQGTSIKHCFNKVLATNIISTINVPQHTNSAMDGYAIHSSNLDLEQYKVVAEVFAGNAFDQMVKDGEAVKIMTGAPMPKGTDTVVMREQATQIDNSVSFNGAVIKPQQNVRQAGEDIAKNTVVFEKGKRISSSEMGLLASLGIAKATVYRKLKVALFSTGDEVQELGSEQEKNKVFDSNRYALMGLLEKLGIEVIDLGILADNTDEMLQALEKASLNADAIITSGGVSVGDADFVKTALDTLGNVDFWRINMRPGRPLAFGQINNKAFFALPGNPVAVMVSFINFVEPALRKMQGETNWQSFKLNAIASEDLRSRLGRTEFSRGVYEINSLGQLCVRSTGKQGAGILRSMSEANCLIEISPDVEKVKAGESVSIIPLPGRI